MILENYTSEVFIKNFLKDRHEFGEDAQYFYEEIFSGIMGKDISLDSFVKKIDKALQEDTLNVLEEIDSLDILSEDERNEFEELLSEGLFGDIKEKFNKIFNPLGLEYNIFGGIKKDSLDRAAKEKLKELDKVANGSQGFFSSLKNKVAGFFGNLKGKSFGEIMQDGLAWFKNPENMSKALGTTGGIVLLGFLLRALKKKKKMKEYNKLHDMADEAAYMNEDIIDNSMNKVINECKENKKLNNILFGDAHQRTDDYFGY